MTQEDNVRSIWQKQTEAAAASGQLPRSWGAVALNPGDDDTGMGYGYDGDPDDLKEAIEDRDERAVASAADEEIELMGEDTTLTLNHRRLGFLVIVVPPMTLGRIEMFNRYQLEAEREEDKLARTSLEDKKAIERMAHRSKVAKQRLLAYAIPDFPMECYDDMPAKSFVKMMNIVNRMKDEASGDKGRENRPNR